VNTSTAISEVVRPASGADVAAALKRASDARLSVLICGSGTKIDWGRPPARVDLVLDMRGLNRVIAHQHGDLTATIEAGATLREVNVTLARHGQWLPLDPPFGDDATIGGVLATNDSGPLRHRFGTPRDLVIGVTLATTDGVVSKAGGQVVKNVAGYDLSKLVTGSFGSLAAIVSATFKLSPLPATSKTLLVEVADAAALGSIVRAVMASQLEPIAFEIHTRPSTRNTANTQPRGTPDPAAAFVVVLRFASLAAVVDAQVQQAMADLKGWATSSHIIEGDAERAFWREHGARVWNAPGAVVRASWLPAEIGAVLGAVDVATAQACRVAERDRRAGQSFAAPTFVARAAVGAGLVAIDGDDEAQASVIRALRQSRHLGNVVVVRGSPALKTLVDVWGSMGDRQPLLEAMKRAFDPTGVLNAGRGPL
jgi:glycolate oxidase FAD binding subunit